MPNGPAHPYQQGHQPRSNCLATADGIDENGQDVNSWCIPSSIMAELTAKSRNASTCTTNAQRWGSFRSVVLPAKVSRTRIPFDEKSNWQQDGDHNGGGRQKLVDVSARWVVYMSAASGVICAGNYVVAFKVALPSVAARQQIIILTVSLHPRHEKR